jgi:hypothetical protein
MNQMPANVSDDLEVQETLQQPFDDAIVDHVADTADTMKILRRNARTRRRRISRHDRRWPIKYADLRPPDLAADGPLE